MAARLAEAVRLGRVLEELNFYWYEDPLADQDIYNYTKLKQQLSIPIMATEYPQTGLDSYQPWIMEKATDYLRGDVAVKGGITTVLAAKSPSQVLLHRACNAASSSSPGAVLKRAMSKGPAIIRPATGLL